MKVKSFHWTERPILFSPLAWMQAHSSNGCSLKKKSLAVADVLPTRGYFFPLNVVFRRSSFSTLGAELMWSINYSLVPPPPNSFHITVYTRANILSGAHTHVPDIKLLMKYLPDLKGLLQPAPKPQSPWNISWYMLVSRLWRRSVSPIWNRSIKGHLSLH